MPKLDKKRFKELLEKDPHYREQRETMTRVTRVRSEVEARLSKDLLRVG